MDMMVMDIVDMVDMDPSKLVPSVNWVIIGSNMPSAELQNLDLLTILFSDCLILCSSKDMFYSGIVDCNP